MSIKIGKDTDTTTDKIDLSYSDVGIFYKSNELGAYEVAPFKSLFCEKLGGTAFDSEKENKGNYNDSARKKG